MQNSSERLYCSFQWKTVGNQPTVTYLSPDWIGQMLNYAIAWLIGGYVRYRNYYLHSGHRQSTFSLRVSRTRFPDFSCHISFSKKQRIKTCQFHTYEKRLLFSLRPLFPNWTAAHSLQMPICHANALFDSEFYRRKIVKNLGTLLRKLIEIR